MVVGTQKYSEVTYEQLEGFPPNHKCMGLTAHSYTDGLKRESHCVEDYSLIAVTQLKGKSTPYMLSSTLFSSNIFMSK